MVLMETEVITVAIERSPHDVYDFIVDPTNLPQWAPNFARWVTKDEEGWVVATSDGPMRIAFVDRNDLGVADHYVTVTKELKLFNPMRVIPNGKGSEVMFTLFRRPDASAEQFSADARSVRSDLQTLKSLLEGDNVVAFPSG